MLDAKLLTPGQFLGDCWLIWGITVQTSYVEGRWLKVAVTKDKHGHNDELWINQRKINHLAGLITDRWSRNQSWVRLPISCSSWTKLTKKLLWVPRCFQDIRRCSQLFYKCLKCFRCSQDALRCSQIEFEFEVLTDYLKVYGDTSILDSLVINIDYYW